MAVSRIHSSDTQIFVSGQRLKGITDFSFSKTREPVDIRDLHSLYISDRINSNAESVEANLSWVLGSGISDPFFDFYSSGIFSVEKFSLEAKDLTGTNVFSGAYVNSYEISASVGELVKGSISYEVDQHTLTTGRLRYSDQTNDVASGFSVFVPKHITVTSSGIECGITSTELVIQSLSFSIPIPRKKINKLGSTIPKIRYPELPIIGDLNISVSKNDFISAENATVLQKGTMTVSLKDCTKMAEKIYTFSDCNLVSFSESLGLDGNATIDFNYKFKPTTSFS